MSYIKNDEYADLTARCGQIVSGERAPSEMDEIIFAKSYEDAVFGTTMMASYSELIDVFPKVTLLELHAFCLGYSLGVRFAVFADAIDVSDTVH